MTKRTKPQKGHRTAYSQLWRVVDGGVRDAFAMHPEYLVRSDMGYAVRNSIVKRVTGAVHSYAVQAARGRSLVSARAAEKAAPLAREGHPVGPDEDSTGEAFSQASPQFQGESA